MENNMKLFNSFVRDEQGQDLIEYALLLAVMVIAGYAALKNVSGNLNTIWTGTNSALANAAS
jgi:Flp pilus assembly pilin Flp